MPGNTHDGRRQAEREKWLADVEARNKKEFETRAVFLGPKPKDLKAPADAAAKGYWLGFPTLDEEITLVDAPGAGDGKLSGIAAKGQPASFTFAVRPLKDLGAPTLTATELKGPGGAIPASAVDLRYIHHQLHRKVLHMRGNQHLPALRPQLQNIVPPQH